MSIVILSRSAGATGSTEQADWNSRISGTGVVWYHNFEAQAEVDNFRFQGAIGTVPNIGDSDGNCRWVGTDGFAGGGCVEINIPTGGVCLSGWWRPFSPLTGSGNGRGSDDPGANGTISAKTYNPNNSNAYNWTQGYYGHTSYHDGSFDGEGYYLQVRVKLSSERANASNPNGKLIFLDQPNGSDQELVIQSGNNSGDHLRFNAYTNFGNRSNSFLYEPQDGGSGPYTSFQPGSDFGAATTLNCGGNSWCWPTGEWVTLLLHLTPGRHDVAETGLQIWIARAGETSYTKVWDKQNYTWLFDPTPNAFNVTKFSGYMNGVNSVAGWTHRFTQAIFSKQTIPCPQV